MTDNIAVEFVKESIFGWIGNLMRDMDAQGKALDTTDIATALEQVAYMIDQEPEPADFDDFLRGLNDGRGHE